MEVIGLFTQMPPPETIAKFRFSDQVEERIKLLLDKNNDGELSQVDEVELDRLTQLEAKLQVVKAKSLVNLHQSTV